jgi:hypothetical protein
VRKEREAQRVKGRDRHLLRRVALALPRQERLRALAHLARRPLVNVIATMCAGRRRARRVRDLRGDDPRLAAARAASTSSGPSQ